MHACPHARRRACWSRRLAAPGLPWVVVVLDRRSRRGASRWRSVRRSRLRAPVSGCPLPRLASSCRIGGWNTMALPAPRRPSPSRPAAVSSDASIRSSAPTRCRVPVPFQSVVLSREGAVPLLHRQSLVSSAPTRRHERSRLLCLAEVPGGCPRPFQLSPSGLPRVVASSVLPSPHPRLASQLAVSAPFPPALAGSSLRWKMGGGGSARWLRHLDHASSIQYVKEQFERTLLSVSPPVDQIGRAHV
mgnify:CR=1 FL=1